MICLAIPPMAKPRQTQSDRWKQRPVVIRYRAWCDEVRRQMGDQTLPEAFWVRFWVPLPPSYSAKRREALAGSPHTLRGDIDNFIKSLMDCLLEDDAHVWRVHAEKRWVDGPGHIEIGELE
jgi:Holliday junction resolvase RusA-like endonuclease